MPGPKDRISTTQVAILLTSTVVGVHYLTMPRVLGESAGRDGWLSLLLGGVLVLAVNTCLVLLAWRFPGMTVVEYSQEILGRLLGRALTWTFVVYYLLGSAYATRCFGEVLKTYLLDRTPLEVIILTFLAVTAYQVNHGLNPLARIDQAFFPLLLAPLLIIVLLAQREADYGELLPVMVNGVGPVLEGVLSAVRVYAGYGLMLFLVPFMRQPRQALKASTVGISIPIAGYVVIFITTLAVLGADNLGYYTCPVADLARAVETPGAFIERLETLLMSLWVITAYTTTAATYYFSVLAAALAMGLKEHRPLVTLWLPVIYFFTMLPRDFQQLTSFANGLGYALVGLSGLVPLMLLLAMVRGKRGGADAS
ncbi:hypothetical protein SY88_11025 [Clostridiales bacterium PH28_bin88]|nr:hypothetical protein SY88_11025 [Clostridiales bacterium PH28_bin88]